MNTLYDNLKKIAPMMISCHRILLYYKANPDRVNPFHWFEMIIIRLMIVLFFFLFFQIRKHLIQETVYAV